MTPACQVRAGRPWSRRRSAPGTARRPRIWSPGWPCWLRPSPGPVLLGFLARARALTAGDVASAEDHYREAIDQHGRAAGPGHLARSHLVYGEWLRRARRLRDARDSCARRLPAIRGHRRAGFAERPVWSSRRPGKTCLPGRRPGQSQPHAPGSGSDPAGRDWSDQRGDRRPAVPQPQHRRLPPAQGVPEARRHSRRQLATRTSTRPGSCPRQRRREASVAAAERARARVG